MSHESSVLPSSRWPQAPVWTLVENREEYGGDQPLLSLSAQFGIRERVEGEGRAASDDTSGYRLVRAGDLVINRLSARDGAYAVSRMDGLVSPAYWVLRPCAAGLDPRWLDYVMRTSAYVAELRRISKFMPPAQFDLPWDHFRLLPIPLPPPSEQRAIAEYLDAEIARIDALIAKKCRLLDLLAERSRQRQINTACGRNLGMVTIDSGTDWLGRIPAHWRIERLKYKARLESGHTPSRTKPELWQNCNTPWITLNDVGYLEAHEFVEDTINLISPEGLAASSARVLPTGTVVFSRDATVGRCGILARPMATSQHFVNWICSPELRPRYLWLLFRTAMQPYFDSLTAGATLRTIGMPDVKALKVPVPPLREQDEIVAEAGRVRSQTNRGIILLQNQLAFLRERRQGVITAAVTGQLDIPGLAT